jgi:catechol 2,3-dioxygenase-like lactoylglutathione lyase family enzyme
MKFHHRANTKTNIPMSVSFYRDVLGLAAHQATDFLEFLLFFWAKDMAGFVLEIELRMRIAKLVVCLD